MTLSSEDVDKLRQSLTAFYAFLCARHQASVHVLCRRLELPVEVVEHEMQDWVEEHLVGVIPVAQREVNQILTKYGLQAAE